ncbi:hypothetical protein RhiLY_01427 [Ceratobasidium sp. AG-Ba]|nr:hypothetical protein RhiLY_01427 [Ceratobasidium sp. AG-Ba]
MHGRCLRISTVSPPYFAPPPVFMPLVSQCAALRVCPPCSPCAIKRPTTTHGPVHTPPALSIPELIEEDHLLEEMFRDVNSLDAEYALDTPESTVLPPHFIHNIVQLGESYYRAVKPSLPPVTNEIGPLGLPVPVDVDPEDHIGEFFEMIWMTLIQSFISERWRTHPLRRRLVKDLLAGFQRVQPGQNIILNWKALPWLGSAARYMYHDFTDFFESETENSEMSVEKQNVLAGRAPPVPAGDDFVGLVERRKSALALHEFYAILWKDCGREEYAMYSIWALREGLENWPTIPLSLNSKPALYSDWPVYRAIHVEIASVWICAVGDLMYKETGVWGPKGNPNWWEGSAPGAGGTRWRGIDGYDAQHERWGLWKSVFQEVAEWHDAEQSRGNMVGWKFGDAARKALSHMAHVEGTFVSQV